MFFGYIGDFGFIFYEDCGLPVKWAGVGGSRGGMY